jgi:hypothetical protein
MKTAKPSSRRRACNLTLSKDARTKAESLKRELVRPSVSSVVEFLVVEKHRALFGAEKGVAA